MKKKRDADALAYPAACLLPVLAAAGYIVWRDVLHRPTIAYCRLWARHHIYCPGCGGTRAVIALFHGQLLRSFYYHPAVPLAVGVWLVYWLSQTVWRLRGRRGWRLRYRYSWPWLLLAVFLVNCALRNLLLWGFGIAM